MFKTLKSISAAALVTAVVVASLGERQSAEAHDDGSSLSVLRALAHDGNSQAAFELGILAEDGSWARVHWFTVAAELEHTGAMCELAQIFEEGRVSGLKDISKAEHWYDSVLEIEYQADVDEWERLVSEWEKAPSIGTFVDPSLITFHPKKFGGSTEWVLSAGKLKCASLRMSRWTLDSGVFY